MLCFALPFSYMSASTSNLSPGKATLYRAVPPAPSVMLYDLDAGDGAEGFAAAAPPAPRVAPPRPTSNLMHAASSGRLSSASSQPRQPHGQFAVPAAPVRPGPTARQFRHGLDRRTWPLHLWSLAPVCSARPVCGSCRALSRHSMCSSSSSRSCARSTCNRRWLRLASSPLLKPPPPPPPSLWGQLGAVRLYRCGRQSHLHPHQRTSSRRPSRCSCVPAPHWRIT